MKQTAGIITTTTDDSSTDERLFTYSEEEKQEQEVNKANAELIFQPAFIPFFPNIQRQYNLTDTEVKVYGFIWFYLSNGKRRFYFTNEQLAEVTNCYPTSISKAIHALEEKGLLKTSRKMRAGGGLIRFVENLSESKTQSAQKAISVVSKKQGNNNKINNNKIKDTISKDIVQAKPVYGNISINEVGGYFLTAMDIPKEDVSKDHSRRYWNLLLKESKTGVDGVKWLINIAATDEFFRNNITSSKDLYYKRVKLIARARGNKPKFAVMPSKL